MAEDYYAVADIDPAYVNEDEVYSSTTDAYIDEEGYRSVYTQAASSYTDNEDIVEAPDAYSNDQAEASSTYYGESGSESSSSYTDNATTPTPSAYGYQGSEGDSSSYAQMTASTDGYIKTPEEPPVEHGTPKPAGSEFSFLRNSNPAKPAPAPAHSPAPSVKDEYYKQKNWNREFQDLLARPDSEEKYSSLSRLANEFVFVAQTYGKVIISELSVPAEEKTVRPVSIGGIAGGEKYIVQGILFKFALDISGIYCGDENAMKAAGHEIIGLSNFYFTQVSGLHFPLMCLIRYCGFCLVAMSILPIGKDTLMYGSSDGGKTVQFGDDALSAKMEAAGMKMNLKPHYAGTNLDRKIVGPGDIEGHRSKDGEYYVVDFARVFPPEASLPTDPKEPGRILYKLLRPELVTRYEKPLSSDALTGWGKRDPDSKLHNAEVVEATRHLLLEIIPKFVSDVLSSDFDIRTLENIPAVMKQRGINVRHLGLVRNLIVTLKNTDEAARVSRLFLIEMFARLLKSRVQEDWRRTVRSHYHINNELCKEHALDLLNSFLDFQSPDAIRYWSTEAKQRLLIKFKGALTPEELAPTFDLRHLLRSLNLASVVDRFSALTGFRLRPQAKAHFERAIDLLKHESLSSMSPSVLFKFLRCDADSIEATIKHTNIVDFADIQALLIGGVNQADVKSSNRYFLLVLESLQRSPHMALMGAHKLLEICSILTRKFKLEGIFDDELSRTVSQLVRCLLSATDEVPMSLRVPILVKAATLLRRIGTAESRDDVTDRLQRVTTMDPTNVPALMAQYRMSLMLSDKTRTQAISEKLHQLCPQNPKYNMTLANSLLFDLKWANERDEDIAKLLGHFSLAAQMDPSIVSKARFLPYPKTQEAQLHVAAAVPLYRPPLRDYYATFKRLHLHSPSPGAGDGLLAPVSAVPCGIEKINIVKALGFTDVGLHKLVMNLKESLKLCYLVDTPSAGAKTVAALRDCGSLRGVKLSGTATTAAEALSVVQNRNEFDVFHIERAVDFTDDIFNELSALPFASLLRSLGVGGTSITPAIGQTFARFSSLSKLFLRETTLDWETCKAALLSLPSCSVFSMEGSQTIRSSQVFQDSIGISHPALEILVMPNKAKVLFSGPYKCISHINPTQPFSARVTRHLGDPTVHSKYKMAETYQMTLPPLTDPKRLVTLSLRILAPGAPAFSPISFHVP
eukprot:TRINITY_DN2521_c0_g1_i1.p1 TRINITY_DN2521_c0_g1~~TRINITY_DN2521_c0_g1_i1.p1  ORF type:complete len:1209 (+),score=237.81 TRINITY_DN2521_c0_g1_i1:47-3628(+)